MDSINRVIFGDETLVDLHNDTVDENSVLKGRSFHLPNGSIAQGNLEMDHDKLINRDMDDQHPISAVTSLEAELSARPNRAMTNLEIRAILDT